MRLAHLAAALSLAWACSSEPPRPACGDGKLDPTEACDDGNGIEADVCTNACLPARCGDGILADLAGEACDDGNLVDGDGCDSTCQPRCGDGIPFGSEACDDGNSDDLDACKNDCTRPACGDGVLTRDGSEECDDGVDNGLFVGCLPDCHRNRCGDGWLWIGVEACEPTGRAPPHSRCDPASCSLSCEEGFEHCGGPLTLPMGCDADLSTPLTCGTCDRRCDFDCWRSTYCSELLHEGAQPFGLVSVPGRAAWQDGPLVLLAEGLQVTTVELEADLRVGVAVGENAVYFARRGELIRFTPTESSSIATFDAIERIEGDGELLLVATSSGARVLRHYDRDGALSAELTTDSGVGALAFDGDAFYAIGDQGLVRIDESGTTTIANANVREVAADGLGVCFITATKLSCRNGGAWLELASDLSSARSLRLSSEDVNVLSGDLLLSFPRQGGRAKEIGRSFRSVTQWVDDGARWVVVDEGRLFSIEPPE
ncbi:MAG: DUF4215 domain-containing protein [Deltaproteobacteria bacterium]|nr:DUF4215 domain-containing protein [Deltaproteobacteria bacterium]